MALNIPVGFGYVAWRFRLASDPEEMVITCGFSNSVGFPGGGDAIAEALSTAFLTAFIPGAISSQYTFVGTTVRWMILGPEPDVFEDIRNVVGTFADPVLPQNSAALVRKNTPQAGRRGKGRMYVPPFPLGEGVVDARGVIDPAVVVALQARFDTLFTEMSQTVTPYLLHTITPPPIGPVLYEPTIVTGFTLESRIATRRLRMRP